jgi:hypothetical protein
MRTDAGIVLDSNLADLLAYHIGCIYRETGKLSLSARDGVVADVEIRPSGLPAESIWDSVTINGHSCGNRHGGAKAYARLVAGDPEWFRSYTIADSLERENAYWRRVGGHD